MGVRMKPIASFIAAWAILAAVSMCVSPPPPPADIDLGAIQDELGMTKAEAAQCRTMLDACLERIEKEKP